MKCAMEILIGVFPASQKAGTADQPGKEAPAGGLGWHTKMKQEENHNPHRISWEGGSACMHRESKNTDPAFLAIV